MKDSYWDQIIPPLVSMPVNGDVVRRAHIEPEGTVRVLYLFIESHNGPIAFVNHHDSLLWRSCVGCRDVEEQCPEHGHLK